MKICAKFIILLLLSGCNLGKEANDTIAIERLIHLANDSSLQGHINRNVKQIIAVYTPDAILFPPGETKPVKGMQEIKAYYQNGLSSNSQVLKVETRDLQFDIINADHAVQAGEYTMLVLTPEKDTVHYNGEMLIYWKKIDNQWKIQLDMWH